MLNAKVKFFKDVEKDNYFNGCCGGISSVHDETFDVEFEDKDDLLQKLAKWTSRHFDVKEETFLKYVENECENNRFDYAQPEDADGDFKHITEDDPEGYYAMYFYHVEVYKKVSYTF
jgi:hypothetical protein